LGDKIENAIGRACSKYGGKAYRGVWWGNVREKRPLIRSRRRWEDNIKMDLQEVGCGGTNWIELAQDRDRWRALVRGIS